MHSNLKVLCFIRKLAIVFAEAPEDIVSSPHAEKKSSDWDSLCPKWEALKSGKQFSMNDLE